jgi:hypothetical protein
MPVSTVAATPATPAPAAPAEIKAPSKAAPATQEPDTLARLRDSKRRRRGG